MRCRSHLPGLLSVVLFATGAVASESPLPAGRDFGAGLTLSNTTPLGEIVAEPEEHAGKPVLVNGRLTDLCVKKGCWTVLADGDALVRVTFQDYGFFLPPEALGRRALVEGVAEVKTLSEREARHYASESRGGDPDSIDGPQREVGFVASGVRLLAAASPSPYSEGPASRDGTGRFYMGREISHVMGHQGAVWLERPSREEEERTDLLLESLPLEPSHVVVDLGAGTGYFSLPIARKLTKGRVLAVDVQPEMLGLIRRVAELEGLSNVEPVLATAQDPRIPADSADLVLLVDAYHEFSHPREVMQGVVKGLRPGGRVVLVEYRAEDPTVPIKPLHKMSEQQAIRELEAVGLRWKETRGFLPRQHVLIFEKPAEG